ncbi:serine/threonine-protein kinase [Streptomyces sp. MAR4 CNX-425]|uniref:serine/threonine-protein kinase n=1 Tax=Streptomyces sp. MAR4 CNX-425 TaxID=3406343 RepID=UPI003B50F97B
MQLGDNGAEGPGRLLAGRYRVLAQLGRGGMGTVWRAVDERLGREVAVKELRAFSDSDARDLAEMRLRTEREARAAARVRHPGVVAVHDVTEHEGRPVIVMELVDGPSLDDVLRELPLRPEGVGAPPGVPPAEAAQIGLKVVEALGAAHRAGVLHRDVKPGNILLEHGGRVVLTDFGIAAMEEPADGNSTHLTRSGELVGSLDYLAPERARGEQPGPPSDLWSLGATLYAAVEGISPFRRTSTWSTITAIIVDPLPEPRRAGPLAPVLRALMAKDPAERADVEQARALLAPLAGTAGPPAAQGPDTMRLGRVPAGPPGAYGPGAPAAPPGPGTPPGRFGPPQLGAPGAESRTAEQTVPQRRRPGRRWLPVAAAVAVLLAGGGVTYALAGGDDGTAASGEPAAPGSESASPSPGKTAEGRKRDGKDGKEGRDGKDGPGGKDEKDADAEREPDADGGSAPAQEEGSAAGGAAGDDGDGGGSGGGDGSGDGSGSDGGGSGGGDDGGSTSGGGGDDGGSDPAPSCTPIGGGKYNCQVWRTAASYDSAHRQVGTLYAGTNYFYCQQKKSYRETSGEWTNVWWGRTDDDNGNVDVWVSVVYVKGGANDAPVPGLPVC